MIITVRQFNPSADIGFLQVGNENTTIKTIHDTASFRFGKEAFARQQAEGGIWLAESESGLIGMIFLNAMNEEEKPFVSIQGLLVDQDYYRRGIGGLLMHKADIFADRTGIRQLVGRIDPENQAALSLFTKCLFTKEGYSHDLITMIKERKQWQRR